MQKSFNIIRQKITFAPIMSLYNFSKKIEMECDASSHVVGDMMSQEEQPIDFFSEKLSDPKTKYSTCDLELYAVIRAMQHWRHYLLHQEFILHTGHIVLNYINGQEKLSS